MVWPGLGHFGHSTGRALLLISSTLAAIVIGLGYAATRDVATLLAWSSSRPPLQILVAGALGVLVLRVAVTVDAYRTAALQRPPGRRSVARRFGNFVVLVLVFVVIVAPHVIAVRFAVAQLVFLSSVFDATDTQTATATPVPTTTLTKTPDPAPSHRDSRTICSSSARNLRAPDDGCPRDDNATYLGRGRPPHYRLARKRRWIRPQG